MNGVLRSGDVGKNHGKQRAVLQHRDAVAFVDGAFRQPREHRQGVFDIRVGVQVELEVRRAAARV